MLKIKDTPIIIFYILYFTWLLIVTFFNPEINILNYFTGGIILFYFIFLREGWDIIWFVAASTIPILLQVISFSNWQFSFELASIKYIPLWLPLSWGTTVVALRKLYLLLSFSKLKENEED